jgi:hypothetical protein
MRALTTLPGPVAYCSAFKLSELCGELEGRAMALAERKEAKRATSHAAARRGKGPFQSWGFAAA